MSQTREIITLGSEHHRGEGEPLRLLLEYLGINNYKDVRTDAHSSRSSLRTQFPSVPYIIDGQNCVTEQDAIVTHLCFKFNRPDLIGRNPEEVVMIKTIRELLEDVNNTVFTSITANPNFPVEGRRILEERIQPKIKQLSIFLHDKNFLFGDDVRFVDFKAYETLRLVDLVNRALPAPQAPVQQFPGQQIPAGAPGQPIYPGAQPVVLPPGQSQPISPPGQPGFQAPAPYGQPPVGALSPAPIQPPQPKLLFEDFVNLGSYLAKIEALPQIRDYHVSQRGRGTYAPANAALRL